MAFIETYNRLKSEAGNDEPILFIDGVHPTQRTKLAYGWMPKWLKTVAETTGSHTWMNIMGALSLKDICRTVIREYDTINAENIARLFIAIRETYPITQKLSLTEQAIIVVNWGKNRRMGGILNFIIPLHTVQI